jgi:hypothetical protein
MSQKMKTISPRTDAEIIRFYLEDYAPGTNIKRAFFMEKTKITQLARKVLYRPVSNNKNIDLAISLINYVNNVDRSEVTNQILTNPVAYRVNHAQCQ